MRPKIYGAVIVSALAALCCGTLVATANEDVRAVETAHVSTGDALSVEAGSTTDVPIVVATSKPLAGMQISLKYEVDIMTPGEPATTERTAGMSIAHNVGDGRIILLLYDVSGKTVAPGTGPVVTIPFALSEKAEGRSELVFQHVILADEHAHAIPAEVKSVPMTVERALPTTYALSQNYPNPFNPETVIEYELPEESHVTLTVYNVLGQEIRRLENEVKPGGYYKVVWDGKNEFGGQVATGIYFYRLEAGAFTSIRKMMILK